MYLDAKLKVINIFLKIIIYSSEITDLSPHEE